MTLTDKQCEFAVALSWLIDEADKKGLGVQLLDLGIEASLSIHIALHDENGPVALDDEAWSELGEYWESMSEVGREQGAMFRRSGSRFWVDH